MGQLFAGRYELVDPLGHGGMGAVWRTWDHKSGAYVAAKLLRYVDATSLLRFVREQAFRIDHPHVVTPLNWAAEDDRVLYTMPLVRGGSVATLRNDFGALPPDWAALLLDQLLDALTAVHGARVVHRDLKPANLLLEPTGRNRPHLRLSDFGIAAAIGEPRLTGPSYIVGTPGYLAPEQLRGAGPEPRQDLYSAGVVAAALLFGRTDDDQPTGQVAGPPPPEIPKSLWRLLGRLTADLPEDRPSDVKEARAELAATGCVPRDWHPAPGDSVEVFEQLPPYPPGWGPAGPDGRDGTAEGTGASAKSSAPVNPGGTASPGAGAEAPAVQRGGPEHRTEPIQSPMPATAKQVDGTTRMPPEKSEPDKTASVGHVSALPWHVVARAFAWTATVAGLGLMVVSAILLWS